jgi:hypothetical protein
LFRREVVCTSWDVHGRLYHCLDSREVNQAAGVWEGRACGRTQLLPIRCVEDRDSGHLSGIIGRWLFVRMLQQAEQLRETVLVQTQTVHLNVETLLVAKE